MEDGHEKCVGCGVELPTIDMYECENGEYSCDECIRACDGWEETYIKENK
jgi:hypothetical protein